MKSAEIEILLQLSSQKRDKELMVLTALRGQISGIDQQSEALRERMRAEEQAMANAGGFELAVAAKWQNWARFELVKLAQCRAELEVNAEAARLVAAKGDAKTRVIGGLLDSSLHAELHENRRRAEQNGVEPDR